MDATIRGYRFADFQLEPAKRRLADANGDPIPLSARAYDVHVHLVEHRDRLVSKDELLKVVWPNTIVEDNNLNQAVSAVRRALGDTRETPRFIVKVAGRGYRFVGDVSPLPDDSIARGLPGPSPVPSTGGATPAPSPSGVSSAPGAAETPSRRVSMMRRTVVAAAAIVATAVAGGSWWKHAGPRSATPRSIAVLPFRPLLPDARNYAMELGVTELLTNRLSRLQGIVVLPLSSVMRFAAMDSDPVDAGRQLRVDAVVEGRVYVEADRLRLTARLLDVHDSASLWANSYTEQLGELLAVQDTLATQLAMALTPKLSDEARSDVVAHQTADVEAWQQYAHGRYALDRRDEASLRRAVGFFEAALRRDPRFALASAGLSDALTLTAVFGIEPPVKGFVAARQAALRAQELDPRLPEAQTALGHVVTQHDRDLEGGRRHYLEALRLQPGFARAMAQMALNLIQAGDLQGASDYIRKARALEPASLPFIALSGWVAYFARGYDDAERQLSQLVEIAPGAALPRQFLAHVLLGRGEGRKVVGLLEGHNDPAPSAFSNLARAYAQVHDVAAAEREIERIEALGSQGYGVGFDLALIHAELGARDAALDGLERGMGDDSQMQCYLNVEPALDSLRGETRFRALSRKLGLG
jgi:DNA-binding winged helix-turn-helix (wHTH) protein/TolB-like protein